MEYKAGMKVRFKDNFRDYAKGEIAVIKLHRSGTLYIQSKHSIEDGYVVQYMPELLEIIKEVKRNLPHWF